MWQTQYELCHLPLLPEQAGQTGLLDLYQSYDVFKGTEDWTVLATGTVVSFVSALILIRVLVAYVAKRDFMVFAWYRIASGLLILLFAFTGWKLW